jgi:beta-aspartyl-peptidase (threonine type)
MERSPHVFLSGRGADQFARERGLEIEDPAYFRTEAKWNGLQRELVREAQGNGEGNFARLSEDAWRDEDTDPPKFGTVGAVALDRSGNLAAGTSSGGMTNKRWGRIGDSPVIGSGTWADNATCAVSATGHGEFFLRNVVAHDIHARMAYKNESVAEASHGVIRDLEAASGAGGVIALDAHGNAALPFNTPGMYRGTITEAGDVSVAIYDDE